MSLSVFDMFKPGVGPSSSHTVGPMRATREFVDRLRANGRLERTKAVEVHLYGSLSATGKGHATDRACLIGLLGIDPAEADPASLAPQVNDILTRHRLRLGGMHDIDFDPARHLVFHDDSLPAHPNGLRLLAFDAAGKDIDERVCYSVGGGFVVDEADFNTDRALPDNPMPYPFHSAEELLTLCHRHGFRRISDLMWANELAVRSETEIHAGLAHIWDEMQACVRRGLETEGTLPGGLKVRRRAPMLHRRLNEADSGNLIASTLGAMDWVDLWALAVNEENAAGGRVVTAPTNGAAGIVPAVLHYYARYDTSASTDAIERYLLTAAAIGILCKLNASISGAEVGCQGEVGSACAMAAGGLAEVLGGSLEQVENAAEIGLEHNLGLTCDPVAGLVQVPCIERNAMASLKAINAAQLALRGDGQHLVSLDKAIDTLRDTGRDMMDKYKETSRGGLAVNVIAC
ncbi:L-serine ammonia-lyase [Pseudomonas sp. ZM23]|uniref:L-serine dehydratase n=1 Tax=Pseudomonas triclosanedens TaxID=2961893 RepID=A0ABY7A1H4_9PSED|nr:L-serine ammonia-lyase [Pseudomonas triclosanedens]MCP8464442.1 L-serine ammonia-lyase [Pseudomonas triclosanedens]MCP8471576.1 L-serine ammonia-lyase [Pseudomonas triclosanedens]MCP8477612.1 L-serine ammonia-lyase [Pseudomonas triclosanedens]WAI51072.1 L-serine ammonia-lyase [Pseudomonas triclosanedens]